MTPATVRVSKPAKRAMPWSSWTTKSPVRRSANERSAPRRPTAGARGDAAAVEEAVVGDHRESQRRRDEALAQRRLRERQAVLRRVGPRARPRAAARGCGPRARRRRAATRSRPCGSPSAAGARARPRPRRASAPSRPRPARAARSARRPRASAGARGRAPRASPRARRGRRRGRARVCVVEGGADVGPVVAQRRRDLLGAGQQQLGVVADQLEQRR